MLTVHPSVSTTASIVSPSTITPSTSFEHTNKDTKHFAIQLAREVSETSGRALKKKDKSERALDVTNSNSFEIELVEEVYHNGHDSDTNTEEEEGDGRLRRPLTSNWTPSSGGETNISKMRMTPMKQSLKNDVLKTVAWILVAVVAAASMWRLKGRNSGLEFVTGYIVEYSLSVDNLFVFLLIFRYFKVPREIQERVLVLGIFGAMALRGIMIIFGEWLTKRFEWVSLCFAALLLYSAVKLLLEGDEDDEDLDNNRIVRFSKRLLPLSDRYHGDQFFIFDNGRVLATPLMVVLISIELSDVVFAMDSVPAVLGISKDPYVIYSSNILAVMGLRSLFFVISDAICELRFLRQSLALVLGFVGAKMIAAFMGKNLGVFPSLMFVVCTLVAGITLSLIFPSPSSQNSHNTNGVSMISMDRTADQRAAADTV